MESYPCQSVPSSLSKSRTVGFMSSWSIHDWPPSVQVSGILSGCEEKAKSDPRSLLMPASVAAVSAETTGKNDQIRESYHSLRYALRVSHRRLRRVDESGRFSHGTERRILCCVGASRTGIGQRQCETELIQSGGVLPLPHRIAWEKMFPEPVSWFLAVRDQAGHCCGGLAIKGAYSRVLPGTCSCRQVGADQ